MFRYNGGNSPPADSTRVFQQHLVCVLASRINLASCIFLKIVILIL